MQFLADESCDFAVVNALREAGHDVVAVKDVLPGAPDEAVIGFASRDARVLLTEDKDFGQLVFSSAVSSPGVIFIRFPGNAPRGARKGLPRARAEDVPVGQPGGLWIP